LQLKRILFLIDELALGVLGGPFPDVFAGLEFTAGRFWSRRFSPISNPRGHIWETTPPKPPEVPEPVKVSLTPTRRSPFPPELRPRIPHGSPIPNRKPSLEF
jgi:hypothetical protein